MKKSEWNGNNGVIYMSTTFCSIKFSTDLDLDSPEIWLSIIMPMILIYYSIINGLDEQTIIIYSIVSGILIYLSATILKNIAAKFLGSERAIVIRTENNSKDKIG